MNKIQEKNMADTKFNVGNSQAQKDFDAYLDTKYGNDSEALPLTSSYASVQDVFGPKEVPSLRNDTEFTPPLTSIDDLWGEQTIDKVSVDKEQNFNRALDISLRELVRFPHKDDSYSLNNVYIENSRGVREYIVKALRDDSLYGESVERFIQNIKNIHVVASANNVYGIVGEGQVGLGEEYRGVFHEYSQLMNHRYNEARRACDVAMDYGDAYKTRFDESKSGFRYFYLPGIPRDGLSKDYSEGGALGSYTYYYPSTEFIVDYFKQAQMIGNEIQEFINSSNQTEDILDAVDLIARQYQYLAIARPFMQINNSIFMNLVNAQIKFLGLEGVPHDNLDTIAQRLGPDSFSRFFTDFVLKNQHI
ncbi:hypothetical protein KC909_05880 [Candidatus Dojkabacteria bacterium]|uniref:Uncharacterized protein n=1 Tax=Candidatus Dojkabacteria bacterium TaxID=2099670 RepID=A0A955RJV3_9BACT|nr:hypothetical protein [Candidatus Dojkabacteria bacterium]